MIQSRKEEFWNALTHGLGVILGLVGLVLLLWHDQEKTSYSTLSIIIYALSIVVLFSASTAYHIAEDPHLKNKLRILDHISIYILIAGTYTPVALITLEKDSGWFIFWTVWGIALLGSILKLFFTGRFEKFSLFLYLAMGWLIVFDLGTLWDTMSRDGLLWMAVGGAFYTIGTVFYAIPKIPYNHVIWHVFVLGGAVSHYFMVLLEVI